MKNSKVKICLFVLTLPILFPSLSCERSRNSSSPAPTAPASPVVSSSATKGITDLEGASLENKKIVMAILGGVNTGFSSFFLGAQNLTPKKDLFFFLSSAHADTTLCGNPSEAGYAACPGGGCMMIPPASRLDPTIAVNACLNRDLLATINLETFASGGASATVCRDETEPACADRCRADNIVRGTSFDNHVVRVVQGECRGRGVAGCLQDYAVEGSGTTTLTGYLTHNRVDLRSRYRTSGSCEGIRVNVASSGATPNWRTVGFDLVAEFRGSLVDGAGARAIFDNARYVGSICINGVNYRVLADTLRNIAATAGVCSR